MALLAYLSARYDRLARHHRRLMRGLSPVQLGLGMRLNELRRMPAAVRLGRLALDRSSIPWNLSALATLTLDVSSIAAERLDLRILTLDPITISAEPSALGALTLDRKAIPAENPAPALLAPLALYPPSVPAVPPFGEPLTLNITSIFEDQMATINIIGATPDSVLSIVTGSLPDGMSLDSAARKISGTPVKPQTAYFTLRETRAGNVAQWRETPLTVTVTDVVEQSRPSSPPMFHGINLAGAEYADGTYWPSNAIVDYYADRRFNLVRLPFKWSRLQPSLNGPLDAANLAEMSRLVTRTTGHGMWIALDMHNYMRRGTNGEGSDLIGVEGSGITPAHYADGWAKIAEVFKDNPRVIFNLMNEPHGIDHTISIQNQNAAAAAIRATGATNLILFSPGHYSGAHQFNYGTEIQNSLGLIRDPGDNWMLDIHQYLDTGYGGMSPVAVAGVGGATTMGTLTKWAKANGVRVIVGEFNSGPSAASQREINAMLNYIADNPDVYQGWVWWSGGQGMDNAYYNEDPYILDPTTSRNPVDRPQMAVLQAHMPQNAGNAPCAPFAVELAPTGSGELVLAYQPGAGSTAHEYRVNGGAWQTASAPSVTVTGLVNAVPAAVDLRAVNANGTSPVVSVSGTPVAPLAWQPFTGATVDLDFTAGKYHGLAVADAISRDGGLDITREGLLLQDRILVSNALRDAAAGKAGTIMMEVEGLPDAYGGEIWAGIRIDATDAGVAAFFSFERISWQTHKAKAASGAPGARQRIMLSWDTTQPSGQQAWMTVSGKTQTGAADNHAADRANTDRFRYLGTHNGTADPVMSSGAANPRLKRLCVWSDMAVSKAAALDCTSLAKAS